jgi:hypothetical protein
MLALILTSEHQSGWTYLFIIGVLALFALLCWLLGRLIPHKGYTAAGNALIHAEVLFRPSRQNVIEAKLEEHSEEEENGDPPTTET